MSYGPEQGDMYRAAARYVGRIFSGTKPADLPIEQPTQFELVVNMRAPSQRILQEKRQPRPVTVSGFSGISLGWRVKFTLWPETLSTLRLKVPGMFDAQLPLDMPWLLVVAVC